MGYWAEVKDVLRKGFDIAIEELKTGTETIMHKGKDGISYAQYKKDLFVEHRKLQNLLADLGDLTHDLYKEKKDIYSDETVKDLMNQIIEIEKKCKKIEDEIADL
ncbi:MAG: hypothetical protein OEZ22_12190 [Spirochaetia bacterium]|nr:hypothetical protein [Spirochaetia bacterium]